MAIFCIGQACFDITAPYTGPLTANQKYRITHSHTCSGGPALNAACLCAMWGAPVQLVARLGRDPYGELVRSDLEHHGVGSDYLVVDPESATPYSLIAVDDATGDRTIFNMVPRDRASGNLLCEDSKLRSALATMLTSYEGSQLPETPMPHEAQKLPGTLAPIPASQAAPEVILSDGYEPEASLALMGAWPSSPSMVDADTYRSSTYEVARACDYLVCSEDFARQYTGYTLADPDDIHEVDKLLASIERINGSVAVVTLGDRGLVFRDGEGVPQHMPAFVAHAVDTTGAGDIFHGAFAYGLYTGLSLEENLKQSSMAGSLSVRRMGSLASIPKLEEVRAALAEEE